MVPNRTVDDTDLTDVSTACAEVIFEGKVSSDLSHGLMVETLV